MGRLVKAMGRLIKAMTNGQISRGELYGYARKYATIVPVYAIILNCITFQIEYVLVIW